MIRSPAVAGQFYASDPDELTANLRKLIPLVASEDKHKALAVMAPHAGYVYSGAVAGETFARIDIPNDVLILGPNHHGQGEPVALMSEGAWQMPMGQVPINAELAAILLAASSRVRADVSAHQPEHSLEVQVPFLQFLRPDVTITPLVVSRISYEDCEAVGTAIASAIKQYNKPVLLVASSDMTHYEPRKTASAKDKLALEKVKALDPEGLYKTVLSNRISMCGVMPTTVALVAALGLGARQAELVRYTDSGETSGDIRQVVGYAGLIVS